MGSLSPQPCNPTAFSRKVAANRAITRTLTVQSRVAGSIHAKHFREVCIPGKWEVTTEHRLKKRLAKEEAAK